MRLILTLLASGIYLVASAQNWSPLVLDKIANYKRGNSSVITNCIWVTDTTILNIGDSCFILNRSDIKSDDRQLLIRNQPQFLLDKMVKKEHGVFLFTGGTNYIIDTKAPLGSVWIFDTLNSYTAAYTSAYIKNIFGICDSVKLFAIYDNHEHVIGEIILSKSLGIIKFPVFDNYLHYNFCGFQNDTIGEQVIMFPDIYTHLSINDVLEYHGEDADYGNFSVTDFTRKYTITDKTLSGDTVIYDVDGYYYAFIYDTWNNTYEIYSYPYNDQLVYISRPEGDYNKLPNQIIKLPLTYYYVDSLQEDKEVYTTISLANSQVHKVKTSGGYDNLYVFVSDDSDTLYKIDYSNMSYYGSVYISRAEELGFVSTYSIYGFERYYKNFLAGYIINGDTTGTITPDSILVNVSKKNDSLTPIAILFPNPARSHITITIKDNHTTHWSFRIFDVSGVQVFQRKKILQKKTSFNINGLPPGLYLYQVRTSNNKVFQGKFIKQ